MNDTDKSKDFLQMHEFSNSPCYLLINLIMNLSDEIKEMLMLYKDKQDAIDRSSIRGVQAKRDLYNALDKNNSPQNTSNRPRLDPNSLHRQSRFLSNIMFYHVLAHFHS